MKSLLLIASSGAVAGGLYAGGAFTRGEVYDLPVAEVRSRLAALAVPPIVRASTGASDKADVEVNVGSGSITWKVLRASGRAPRFTARFREESPGRTRVILDYANGKSGDSYVDRLTSTSFVSSYAETSFAEKVDARLEGRAADQGRAMQEFARRAAADSDQVRELGAATEGMFRDVAAQVHEQANAGAERRHQSARETMDAATRPTLILPKQN